jgi:hypothetical protein
MVPAPHDCIACERDGLSGAEREYWDARVARLGGWIERQRLEYPGLGEGAGPRSQTVSWYVVPRDVTAA